MIHARVGACGVSTVSARERFNALYRESLDKVFLERFLIYFKDLIYRAWGRNFRWLNTFGCFFTAEIRQLQRPEAIGSINECAAYNCEAPA